MASGQQTSGPEDYSYGSANAPGPLGMAFDTAAAGSIFGLPLNAAMQSYQYLKGDAPSWDHVQKMRDSYTPDRNKDSYLTAGNKLLRGGFAFLRNPLDGARVIGHEADQGFAKDPSYQWLKQKATGAGGVVSNTYNKMRSGANYAYDQVANAPMGQAFKQPMPVKNLVTPQQPAAKPLAPAAPKPVQNKMPGVSTPGVKPQQPLQLG
jgi:hypothetical protein